MAETLIEYQVPLEQVSEYELLRIIETTADRAELAAALAERDERLRTRVYARDFWSDVFAQETRRLRDNLGGEFVTIRSGSYVVGNYRRPHSTVRRHEVKEPYSIGRFPVTERAYLRFVEEHGYEDPAFWDDLGWQWVQFHHIKGPWLWQRYPYDAARARYPMSGITWFEAAAYCRWRSGRETGAAEIRLPTSHEWECAARGRLGRTFPWGWEADDSRANVAGLRYPSRTPVNRYPSGVSPTGCWDMIGNVSELTADPRYDQRTLYENVVAGLLTSPSPVTFRLAHDLMPLGLRSHGGSYADDWSTAQLAAGIHRAPDERVPTMGFRVVRVPAVE